MEGAAATRRQRQHAFLGVTSPGDRLIRTPVVGDFVIVPLAQHRHFGIEGAHVGVDQIVFVVAAKLRECFSGL